LIYRGFGGEGKQVRDILHPKDLFDLLVLQLANPAAAQGRVFNVGGGRSNSVSLQDFTRVCRSVTGGSPPIQGTTETSPVDIPWYVTDSRIAQKTFGWKPTTSVEAIVREISHWAEKNREKLETLSKG
jgi:CDP-paratose 2-epimerase